MDVSYDKFLWRRDTTCLYSKNELRNSNPLFFTHIEKGCEGTIESGAPEKIQARWR